LELFLAKPNANKVSHYRLAAHLGSAFVLYSAMFWWTLELIAPKKYDATIGAQVRAMPRWMKFRKMAHVSTALVFFTALSGALVAGTIKKTLPKCFF
jgi:cytochrome c oxidase assembly protein subunit 15